MTRQVNEIGILWPLQMFNFGTFFITVAVRRINFDMTTRCILWGRAHWTSVGIVIAIADGGDILINTAI